MWLPWFAVFVRLIVDLSMGIPVADSEYFSPALVPAWPTLGWLRWSMVSWLPIVALLAMLLVYVGWRFFWWADDWVPSYRTLQVVATILVPPLALLLLYRDTRARFARRNRSLQNEVDNALDRAEGDDALRLMD